MPGEAATMKNKLVCITHSEPVPQHWGGVRLFAANSQYD